MSTDLVSSKPYPLTPLKMSSFGCENNSFKRLIESKIRLKSGECNTAPIDHHYTPCGSANPPSVKAVTPPPLGYLGDRTVIYQNITRLSLGISYLNLVPKKIVLF